MNNNIKDTTSLVFVEGKNLFDKNKVIKNHELTNNGADVGYNALWFVSDYIEVKPNTTYYLSGNRTGGTTNAFYDENKTFISYVSKITGDITTPSNVKYMRFNGKLSEIDNNIMLEQNSTATSYEAYVEKQIYIKNENGLFENFFNEENFIKNTKIINQISVSNTYGTIDRNFLNKVGKTIFINLVFTAKIQIPTWTQFGTIPEGFRPDTTQSGVRWIATDLNGNTYPIEFTETGILRTTGKAIPANTLVQIAITYFTD